MVPGSSLRDSHCCLTLTHSPARWTYDPLPLCTKRLQAKRWFAYDGREVRQASPDALHRDCNVIRRAPLVVRFRHEDEALYWTFGPYRDGHYRAILFDGLQGFEVPPEIGYRVPEIKELRIRVRYDSPEGWATYSPDLDLKW